MSSSPPGAESSSEREYATIWHPVREWFEEDDDDHQVPELESPERRAYSDEENGAEDEDEEGDEDEEEYEDNLRLFGNIILTLAISRPFRLTLLLLLQLIEPSNCSGTCGTKLW